MPDESKPNPYDTAPSKNASIVQVRPKPTSDDDKKPIPLCFNPTEYALAKTNTFYEVPVPGLGAPPIQFVRGVSETLKFDAIVDTSTSLKSVKTEYVDRIRKLADLNNDIHAPPIVKFVWEKFEFTGVIDSLTVTYTLFTDSGTPVRAKLNISLKEYPTQKSDGTPAQNRSADVEKTYVVKRGDTLSGIAQLAYGNPEPWRAIARANAITDQRMLEPGQVLTIPALETAS